MTERITEVSPELRDGLPEELSEAEIVGTDTAAVDESLRLHGPPGTGKSTQSALRIGTLAVEKDIAPRDMTVATYRRSLADTIRNRLLSWGAVELPEDVNPDSGNRNNPFRFWTTIHAAAARATGFHSAIESDDELSGMVDYHVEREFCSQLGIRHHSDKTREDTQWEVFKQLYDYGKKNLLDVGQWRYLASPGLRDFRADAGVETLLQQFRNKWHSTDFEAVVKKWESFKNRHDAHDFYEMLEKAIVGPTPPMRVLVIDEYHDVVPLMAAVAEQWISTADTVIVAGDPDQVCNAYAGASPRFFEELDQRVERQMPVVQLSNSWRCRDEHFAAASIVLQPERDVPSLSTAGPGEIYRHTSEPFAEDDRGWHTPDIDTAGSPGQIWRQFGPEVMYLARTKDQAEAIAAAFDQEGIIYDSQNNVGGSWEKRLSLLRCLDVLDGMSLQTEAEGRGIDDYTESDQAQKHPENYALDAGDAGKLIEHSHGRYLDVDKGEWRKRTYNAERNNEPIPLTELIEQTTRRWWDRYTNGSSSIHQFTRLADRDKKAMRAAWERYDSYGRDPNDAPTRILTIHASKGSEASDVVVYDGITSRISEGIAENGDIRENEARTWYVGLTRASERLHIVRDGFPWCDSYLPDDLETRAANTAAVIADGGVNR